MILVLYKKRTTLPVKRIMGRIFHLSNLRLMKKMPLIST
jgi:hypothetical protein